MMDRPDLTETEAALHGGVDGLEWDRIGEELDRFGCAVTGVVFDAEQCRRMADLYGEEDRFRSHIRMARHGFGQGEYKYFTYPLPEPLTELRRSFYARLAPIANRWMTMSGRDSHFPVDHEAFLEICHRSGQERPTPLLLRYGEGDYNCLHQDLYGDLVFPLQVAVLLSEPGEDFAGGEFVMTEQRPRMQSRAEVVGLRRGEAVIFAVNERPVQGRKGVHRVRMRHGVSRVRSGRRHVLGIIFHDAE